MKKKIKVFLGGYVNYLAAQNINCRSLSETLDKDKFEVYTILYPYPNATDFKAIPKVHYLKMNRHMRSLGWLCVFIGILKCDVVYWTKMEYNVFTYILCKLFRKKYFKTVEGILAQSDMNKVPDSRKYLRNFRRAEPYLYGITGFIQKHVSKVHGFKFSDKILYLGVDTEKFINKKNNKRSGQMKNVVFIGNNLINKGIEDYFRMARLHPELIFHIIGTNALWNCRLEDYLIQEKLPNVIYHGKLNHTQMARLLCDMDVMYFTSRAEGFPKVQLEAACAGCPTICYSDYGANEWITSGVNGYVVDTFEEAELKIRELCSNKELMLELSNGAIELGTKFDWKVLVKIWEDEIIKIYNS